MSPRLLSLVAILALWAPLGATLGAAEPSEAEAAKAASQSADVLRFRRVFAPADRLEDWPLNHAKYLPIAPAEFERLLATVRAARPDPQNSVSVQAVSAEYQARLVGSRLAAGQASLRVVHAAKSPVLLPLDPCGLAIGRAIWAGSPSPQAALGMGVDGKLAVLVERSGQLQFEWSLEGHRDAADAVTFALEFPPCPAVTFVLELPETMTPVSDRGLVAQSGWVEEGVRRWRINLGGHHRSSLRVLPLGAAEQRPQLALVRQSLAYDISLRGLEVSCQLKFEIHDEPLRQIAVSVDPGLQLVTARYADAPIPWTAAAETEGGQSKLMLHFPEPVHDSGATLRLVAISPLQTDRRWRLPRVRPEQVFWQEGSATVSVVSPLVLQQIVPDKARQSGTGPLSPPRVGESADFEYFTPDAAVEVVLARRGSSLQALSGTTIELRPTEAAARVLTDFRVAEGAEFSLQADVAIPWSIDTVDSVPPGAVEDWSVQPATATRQKLTVRLSKPVTPDRPTRLAVAARCFRSPLGQKLAVDALVPVRFQTAVAGRRLVDVRAVDPYELETAGSEQAPRLDPRALEARELELFTEPPRGLLFEDGPGAAGLQISLQSRKPRYKATLQVEAEVDDLTLQESYVLRCAAESGGVDRVLVCFSQGRRSPPRFTLSGEEGQPLTARLVTANPPEAAGRDRGAETWEVKLSRPRSTPFDIQTVRQVELAQPQAISLAALPEAAEQQGTVVLRQSGGKGLRIKNSRLDAIPTESTPGDRCPSVRAAFRYDPLREVATAQPALVVTLSDDAVTPPAWVWDCHLESRYQPDGIARHLARFRVQNTAAARVQLSLPSAVTPADVQGVWLDDRRLAREELQGAEANGLALALPSGKRFPTIVLRFTTSGRALGVAGTLRPPIPEIDLPVLNRSWTAWLPPGYGSSDAGPHCQVLRSPRANWRQRLFGPLGRASEQPAFAPLHPDTWSPTVADQAARDAAIERAKALLDGVAAAAAGARTGGQDGDTLRWAALLTSPSISELRLPVLVDRRALANLGLTPQSPVPSALRENARARGIDLLQGSNLALLVHADALLLTSQDEAAELHAWLAPLPQPGLWRVLPGPLAEQLQQAAAGGADAGLVPVETWRQEPAEPRPLWSRAVGLEAEAADTLGWTAYRLSLADTTTAQLPFVHCQTMRLLGWATFLLVACLTWWKGSQRRAALVAILCGGGIAALLVAEAYVPIASGAVLGSLFCLAVGLIGRRGEKPRQQDDEEPKPAASTATWPAVTLGVMLAAAAAVWASECPAEEENSAAKPPAVRSPYQVFVPIDDRQQPTGERYFLPKEFYDQLLRRAAAASEQPQGWLLGPAVYTGTLSRENASERFTVEQLDARWDLRVLSPRARVRIPLRRAGANLLPDGTLLDGRVIQADWEPDGGALVVEVPDPGQYRLELALQPTMHGGAGAAGFDLAIPPLANSRLDLSLPPDAPALEVPSALGSVLREDDPPRLVAELGPSERLSVRWPTGTARARPAVDVEELLWLKIQPGSVVLQAKYKLKVLEGQVRQLQLTADPRLRLLPLQGEEPPAVEVRATVGQPQTLVLRWPRPLGDQTVVEGTFLLTGTSGVGNVRLPQLTVSDARSTRRWLAISIDPVLEHEQRGAERPAAIPVAEFLAAWGKAEPQPQLAFRLTGHEASWSISTRPHEPQTSVDQTLALSFGEESTAVQFDARLVTTAGYRFQLRLTGPAGLEIDRVSLTEDRSERAARWSQDEQGAITVFLTGPVTGRQSLSLRGRLPVPMLKKVPLPLLQIDEVRVESAMLQIYRRPAVLVSLSDMSGLSETEPDPGEPGRPELGHLLHSLRVEPGQGVTAAVTLSPNHPRVRAEQVTWLRCGGQSWQAEVDARLQVREGLLDRLRVEAPDTWAGPYQVTPAAVTTLVDLPGANRQVIVYPQATVAGNHHLQVISSLKPLSGGRVAAPDIRLVQAERGQRFLALPKEAQGQPIAWETQGLKPGALPGDFERPADAGSFAIYEVAEGTFQAILRTPDQARRTARVRLAEVRAAWQEDGTWHGVATFDLEPCLLTQCSLWLPRECRLIAVTVAEVPVAPVAIGQNVWRVPLGPSRLPQRIEVVFDGTLADRRSPSRCFEAPSLGDLPVAHTLWTVAGPDGFSAETVEEGELLSTWQYELRRLKDVAAVMQLAPTPSEEESQEILSWYRPWARRLVGAERAAERGLSEGGRNEPFDAAQAELHAIEQEQAQLAGRLGCVNTLAQARSEASLAREPQDLCSALLDRSRGVVRCALAEGGNSLTLTYRPAESGGAACRWLAATGWGLLVAGGWALGRTRRGWWLKQWPHAVGVAAGLAWWLWLSPSVLGWLIVLGSLAAALRSGWKRTLGATGGLPARAVHTG